MVSHVGRLGTFLKMLGGIFILIITSFLALGIVNILKSRFPFLNAVVLRRLFYYHAFLSIVYYIYAVFNPSDSRQYYLKVISQARGTAWWDFYGTSTTFVEFIAYPFINYFGFTYEAMMALFAFFGYLGFALIYIFFQENIRFKHTLLGMNLLTIFFFLPNLHFWSGSLGKGSVIFLGIGLFFFGISNLRSRWLYIFIGGLIIYHVRPHVMLVILVSSAIGFIFSSKGVSMSLRLVFLAGAAVAFFYIYKDVLNLVGIDDEQFLTESFDLTHRAKELSKATSGIDINNYSLPEQLFAFLYRPLFFDAPGILGLIVSVENVFYLLITLRIFSFKGLNFIIKSDFLVKSAFLSFITVSIALAQISGNLGLAIRQKSQVMILFLFVIISFLDKQKLVAYQQAMFQRARRAKLARLQKERTV